MPGRTGSGRRAVVRGLADSRRRDARAAASVLRPILALAGMAAAQQLKLLSHQLQLLLNDSFYAR